MKLPVMQCDPYCGKCCGPAPCTKSEFDAIVRYAREHHLSPVDQGITCPWYQKGTCQVYPVRPLICRIFGHSEKMVCAKGYNTNVPERQIRKLCLRNGPATLHTHDALNVFRSAIDYE